MRLIVAGTILALAGLSHVAEAQEPASYVLALESPPPYFDVGRPAPLSFVVTDAAGVPVPGARVRVSGSGEESSTDAAGRGSFTVLKEGPGATSIVVRLVEVPSDAGPVPVSDVSVEATLVFTGVALRTTTAYAAEGEPANVTVRARWLHDATPVPGAEVLLESEDGSASATTDEGGAATFPRPARERGVARYLARPGDAPYGITAGERIIAAAVWLSIEDALPRNVSGRVLRSDGSLLPNASLTIEVETVLNERLLRDAYEARSGEDGSFTVAVHATAGDNVTLIVRHGGEEVGRATALMTERELVAEIETGVAPPPAPPLSPVWLVAAFVLGAGGGVFYGFLRRG